MRNKLFIAFLMLITRICFASSDNILNLYGYADYVPDVVLQQFEKETGIHVNYSYYSDDDFLYARLKTDPKSGYDVIIPSSYLVSKMYKEGMLKPLDKSQLSNISNMNPFFMNQVFDPNNNYSIPYTWGTTGILVNKKYLDPSKITSWKDLWDKRFRNQLLLVSDVHDVFGIALITLGYSANDTDPAHITQAYHKLQELMPNVRIISTSDSYMNIYIDEDATIGTVYSGDANMINQANSNLVYIYPQDGFVMWIDCLAIPQNAPHYANALKFINFILRPDIAKQLTMSLGYSTANQTGMALLPPEYRNNPVINPSEDILKHAQIETDTSSANLLYQKYWQQLKLM